MNFISSFNWEFYQKANFLHDWSELDLIRAGPKQGGNMVFMSRE